ncbi:MAG: efflux RND transporter permease subunit [Candidatus Thiodiazotropha sp. (ex Rostrolucina anterorostrata)]|nr:efflux RND transporter permease subunit [Candidatus Thiodiazotropha sp. (ex Rostrolucina anterorostrata)]
MSSRGLIAWFARNPVAANLLMICIVVGGLLTLPLIDKRLFPERDLNYISIGIEYPGAAPQEVEQGITLKVEEAVRFIRGIKRVISKSVEDGSYTRLEVKEGYDPDDVLLEVRRRIDAITSFPDRAEKPKVIRLQRDEESLTVSIFGPVARDDLKELAKQVREEITALPAVSQAKVVGTKDYEIAVEMTEDRIIEYGLSFEQVANAVSQASLNLPGGAVTTVSGDILLRARGQRTTGEALKKIAVKTGLDGTLITLGEVATIRDGFVEQLHYTRFNRKPAINISVKNLPDENGLKISEQVRAYVTRKNPTLAKGVKMETWGDRAFYLQSRLDLLANNLLVGALLVLAILTLFMNIRLAFWVMMGLPVCFFGTILLMAVTDIGLSINLVSLFAFIIALGIVVDDAIIVGESAYREVEKNGPGVNSVVAGVKRVSIPVTCGVLTTVIAFLPMVGIKSSMVLDPKTVGLVVIFCLLFSLVESKLILPAHLARMGALTGSSDTSKNRLRAFLNRTFHGLAYLGYRPLLRRLIDHRYSLLKSYGLPLIILTAIPFGVVGAVAGHWLLDLPMSVFSGFGVIALSGVVVNDSLVMVDSINRARGAGESPIDAAISAGCLRFRAIVVTSLTTFAGILPMLLETSLQAKFVIPMAVSLGFGILFATLITLFLVPVLYGVGADIKYLGSSPYL